MPGAVAALASGGLDSSAMLADMARADTVFPIYVRSGLAWEETERAALDEFIEVLKSPNVQPVTTLSTDAAPLYGEGHWTVTGRSVPGTHEPDSAVFMPGRNILLIGLAAVWCSTHEVSRIAIGSLGGNPFPDATPEFFEAFAGVLSAGLAHRVSVEAPFRGLDKASLIRDHTHLPLDLTLTCAGPVGGGHCGRCNKCYERHLAFTCAGVQDATRYAAAAW